MKYRFLEHTADAKFEAFGKTLEEAFANAARAMASVMIEPDKVKKKIEKDIEIAGTDEKNLLYRFLEKILFLLDAEFFIFSDVKDFKINGNKLTAMLIGDDATKYDFTGEVKAVTYNQMEIRKGKGKFILQVVVDL